MNTGLAWAGRGLSQVVDRVAGPRLSILIFHRVLPELDPLFPGEIDAQRFSSICAALARDYRVMTLGQALSLRAEQRLPPRALAITFDDGYADNASQALPILQRHGLKATFFIATAFLDGGRMWNDSIIECLRRTRREALDLECVGLGSMPMATVDQRRTSIKAVLPRVKYMGLPDRKAAIDNLMKAAGGPSLPDDLMLRSGQVQELHAAGMEIGGHTVHHPILSAIPDRQAKEEIIAGRARLMTLTGASVDMFAYPNGGPDRDYDLRHVQMVREAGFQAAVSTATGVIGRDADLFQLPRFTPWDQGLTRWSLRLLSARLGSTAHVRAQAVAPLTTAATSL